MDVAHDGSDDDDEDTGAAKRSPCACCCSAAVVCTLWLRSPRCRLDPFVDDSRMSLELSPRLVLDMRIKLNRLFDSQVCCVRVRLVCADDRPCSL
jgi:hypothetical protein